MNNFPKGNDLIVKWAIKYSDGTPFPLENYAWELCYSAGRGINVVKDTAVISASDNLLTWRFSGKDQAFYGKYSLTLRLYQQGKIVATVRKNNAFELSTTQYDGPCDIDLVSYCDNISLQDALLRGNKAMEVAQDADKKSTKALEKANTAISKVDGIEQATEKAIAAASSANSAATKAQAQADRAEQNNQTFDEKEAQRDAAMATISQEAEILNRVSADIDVVKANDAEQERTINGLKEQVKNYKPIEIFGNVTNAADEEDITSEDNLLKLKNRSSLNGMGYVILRKNKTFIEQVTEKNTIYEIRYDFDLAGGSVSIPVGCVLCFNGGSVKGGTITLGNAILVGFRNVDNSLIISDNTIRRDIDTDALGMVRNSQADAASNFARLRWGIQNGFNINVRGYLYIENTNNLTITNDIVLLGRDASVDVFACGAIDAHSPLYVNSPINNITIKSVGIINTGEKVVNGGQFIDVNTAQYIKIGAIDFKYLSLSNMRLLRMAGDANNYDASGGNYGFGTLVMEHCNITNVCVILFISDIGFDRVEIAHNNISGLEGIGINASQTNGTTYNNARYGKLILIHDNFVQNNEVLNNSYAYNCFVLSENSVCHYYRNTIKNIFNIYDGDPATYDSYLSCEFVFYDSNIIHNVGSLHGSYQDIFKAKAGGGPRSFTNNRFTFSAAELIAMGWLSSGQETGLYKTIFNAQYVTGNVNISKNYIDIDVPLTCVNIGYCPKSTFCYNSIHALSFNGGTLARGNVQVPSQVFEIAYNSFKNDTFNEVLSMFRTIQSDSSVSVHDNDFMNVCYVDNDPTLGNTDYTKVRFWNNFLNFTGYPGYTSGFGIVRSDIINGNFRPRLNAKCDIEWKIINKEASFSVIHNTSSTILKVFLRGDEEYYIFDYQDSTRTIYTSTGEKTTAVPKMMDDFSCKIDSIDRVSLIPLADKYHFVVMDIPEIGIENTINRDFYYTRISSDNSGWNAIQNLNKLDGSFQMSYLKTLVTDQGKIYSKIGKNLTELDGAAKGVIRQGATTDRPAAASIYAGFVYFDTTLGKPIWYNGSNWVDATGADV